MDAQQPTGSAAGSPDPFDTSADAATGAAPTTGRRARVLTAVKWVAAIVAVAFLVWSVAKQWDKIVHDFASLDAVTVVIGIVFTSFFALGLLMVSLNPTAVDVTAIVMGNILGISDGDVVQVAFISVVSLGILLLKWKMAS